MFIYHTSAPVEVSVWRGGKSLLSDSYAFYDSVVSGGGGGGGERLVGASREGCC